MAIVATLEPRRRTGTAQAPIPSHPFLLTSSCSGTVTSARPARKTASKNLPPISPPSACFSRFWCARPIAANSRWHRRAQALPGALDHLPRSDGTIAADSPQPCRRRFTSSALTPPSSGCPPT